MVSVAPEPTQQDTHFWVSNAAFTRLTGIRKQCLRCGLALEKGERLVEKECPKAQQEPRP